MKRVVRSPFTWVALLIVVLVVVLFAVDSGPATPTKSLSEFQGLIRDGKVQKADIQDGRGMIHATLKDNAGAFDVKYPVAYTSDLTNQLINAGVPTNVERPQSNSFLSYAAQIVPFLLILGLFLFFIGRMGGGGGLMQFGKAKPKMMSKDEPKITFDDVAGADEAIVELHEIKEFLEAPGKFHAIGAKIPKGVLLFGPPGTGKTLLARAVAGEAGVPFFSISGSDFVEMFVGVGASRVRDLFEQARASAPCIIFMDEIDAVGRSRGASMGGGHDEREQTLNQLLVEMDGFDPRSGIIIIAATNRPDVLDPALLRPGRFDRQITVDRPDIDGRTKILKVHVKDIPLHDDVDLEVLARRTPGFTGADLANLVNEGALITARHGGKIVSMLELEEAIDRVIGGPEKKNRVMSDEEKRTIAVHEGGHAIVGHLLEDADPVHKVSVIARGRALGWTLALPTEDKNIHTRKAMKAQLAVLLGGRTAEEVFFNEPSTGASNDIEKVSQIARAMVMQYGMSDELGPQMLGESQGGAYLGTTGQAANYGGEIASKIDSEVRALVDEAHKTATDLITMHKDTLAALADEMVERETLDSKDLEKIWGHLPYWNVNGDNSQALQGVGTIPEGAPAPVSKRAPRASKKTEPTTPAAATTTATAGADEATTAKPARKRASKATKAKAEAAVIDEAPPLPDENGVIDTDPSTPAAPVETHEADLTSGSTAESESK